MRLQLESALTVYSAAGGLSDRLEIGWQLLIDLVQDTFSDLYAIDHIEYLIDPFDR
jgi:hypothetical protein